MIIRVTPQSASLLRGRSVAKTYLSATLSVPSKFTVDSYRMKSFSFSSFCYCRFFLWAFEYVLVQYTFIEPTMDGIG